MQYILGLIVAGMLVVGQAFWKIGVERAHMQLSPSYLFSAKIFSLVFSPFILIGAVIYIVATLLYLGLLAKYEYSMVQGIVVPISLILAFTISQLFFHERLSMTNYAGLLILIVGIIFATRR